MLESAQEEFVSVKELKRVNKIRRDFVANVSHELKTPATSLQLLAESLKKFVTDRNRGINESQLGMVQLFIEVVHKSESEREGDTVL